jgi:hypothetical protein
MIDILKELPPWLAVFLFGLYGFFKFGPVFLKKVSEVRKEWSETDDEFKKEYIAFMKITVERLQKDLDWERKEKKRLINEMSELLDEIEKNKSKED